MKYRIALVGLSILIGSALLTFFLTKETDVVVAVPQAEEAVIAPALPAGIGTDENRFARMEYERMRIVNPATGEVPANIRTRELAFANQLPIEASANKSGSWERRGPFNVGGRTRAMALDVLDEDIIIAGGVTGGMWRSTDAGQSFTKTTTPDQLHSVTCVEQDRRAGKESVWYHGTGEYYAIVSAASFSSRASGNGIYKSTDGGQSWQLLPSTISNTPTTLYQNRDFDFVWNIITDHTNAAQDVVLAAVVNGVFKSVDGGTSWYPVLGLDTSLASKADYTDIVITDDGIMYAAISGNLGISGVWRSDDGGENWTEITPTSGWPTNALTSPARMKLATVPGNTNQIYVLANTSSFGKGDHIFFQYTYLSGDGTGAGGRWSNRTANLPEGDCLGFYTFNFGPYSSQSGYDMTLAVSPADTNLVFLGGTNIYRSTDGFTSLDSIKWIGGYSCDPVMPSNYIYPNHHPDQHEILFLPSDPNTMLNANDGGLYKTSNPLADSVTWASLNNGYTNSQFYTLAIEPGETTSDIIVGGMQDNGTFFTNNDDASQPWKGVFYGDGAYCAITQGRDNYYLSWQTGKVFKFEIDDNGNIQGLTRIDPESGGGYQFIAPFMLNPFDDNEMLLPGGRQIWQNKRLDTIAIVGEEYEGLSGWELLDATRITNFSWGVTTTLDMSAGDSTRLYFGMSQGRVFRVDSFEKAESQMVQVPLTTPDLPTGAYVSSIKVSDKNPNEVWVTYSNYGVPSVFRSLDYGTTWAQVSGNLEENPDGSGDGPAVFWVELLEMDDTTIYFIGTSVGLYATGDIDSMNTVWTQQGESTIGNVVINMITARAHDGLVVVASHGQGMFSKRYKEITSVPEVAAEAELYFQPVPNPFSGSTKLTYDLPAAAKVSLQVLSIDGKVVFEMPQENQQAGQHQIKWRADNVANGIYIARLLMDDKAIVRKVVKRGE